MSQLDRDSPGQSSKVVILCSRVGNYRWELQVKASYESLPLTTAKNGFKFLPVSYKPTTKTLILQTAPLPFTALQLVLFFTLRTGLCSRQGNIFSFGEWESLDILGRAGLNYCLLTVRLDAFSQQEPFRSGCQQMKCCRFNSQMSKNQKVRHSDALCPRRMNMAQLASSYTKQTSWTTEAASGSDSA